MLGECLGLYCQASQLQVLASSYISKIGGGGGGGRGRGRGSIEVCYIYSS